MALNKLLENITESDLQALIDNEVAEGKTIEYKQSLPSNTHDDKKEFLADVSSFANASGGHLIFGIAEDAGLPVDLCGLGNIDADAELLRLENILRDNIEPRIPGISMRAISLQTSGMAIIVYIPRSWAQPHVVNFRGHWRFYSRTSAGKYPLDVSELRAAFNLSETIAERISLFHTGRLGKIVAGETPIALDRTASIVLHLVPFDAFDPALRFDMSSLYDNVGLLAPIYHSGWNYRHNFEGLATYSSAPGKSLARTYLQVFRNGGIEAVETSILDTRKPDGSAFAPSVLLEYELLQAIPRYLQLQQWLGFSPPLLLMLSLLGVKGYILAVHPRRAFSSGAQPIDRNDLILPEIMIEDFNSDPAELMQPAFDAIWNAAGYERCMNYDDEGKWIGDRR